MPSSQAARDEDPFVEVVEVDDRGSHTRMRSMRRPAVELDAHERPTLVPHEPVDAESLEARVLFESRAAVERRYAAATQQDLHATRRIDAVTLDERPEEPVIDEEPVLSLDEPVYVSVDTSALDAAFEQRRTRVRTIALLMMLAFLVAVAVVVLRK
jgi:hypothetical protein